MKRMRTRAFVASAYTNRGGCVRRKCLDRCDHMHRTFKTASECAKRMQKERHKPGRRWCVDEIVWVRYVHAYPLRAPLKRTS